MNTAASIASNLIFTPPVGEASLEAAGAKINGTGRDFTHAFAARCPAFRERGGGANPDRDPGTADDPPAGLLASAGVRAASHRGLSGEDRLERRGHPDPRRAKLPNPCSMRAWPDGNDAGAPR